MCGEQVNKRKHVVSHDTTSRDSHLVFPAADQKTLIYSWAATVYLNGRVVCVNIYFPAKCPVIYNAFSGGRLDLKLEAQKLRVLDYLRVNPQVITLAKTSALQTDQRFSVALY